MQAVGTNRADVPSPGSAAACANWPQRIDGDTVLPWIEGIERYDEILRAGDAVSAAQGLSHVAIVVSECVGAVLHVAHNGRCIASAVQGVPRDFPAIVGVPLDAVWLDDLAQMSVPDVACCAELKGTFASEALQSRGVRSIQSLALHGRSGLAARLTLMSRHAGTLGGAADRSIRLIANRMFLALEHSMMVQAAYSDSARLRAVLDSATDAIIATDPCGRIATANRASTRVFGMTERELVGTSIESLVDPADRELVRSLLSAEDPVLAAGAENPSHQVRRVRVGDTGAVRTTEAEIALEISVSRHEGGLGRTIIVRDVTVRRNTEARMRETDRLAVIGTLAAGLGHDLNNVLFPIRAHTNALSALATREQVEPAEPHIAAIRASVAYLQHLADSLHALALDPEGEGDGIVSTDLREWWEQSGPLLRKALHRVADLEVRIAGSLPPVSVPPHALTRAVLNLLVNAAEAMPEGRACELSRVILRADADARGENVLIEVVDNGIGMSDEVQRRALDMFFTTKTRGLGTGLGLPLVRRVVERAGGALEIRSRPGAGATVRLRVPVVSETASPRPPVASVQIEDGRVADVVRGFLEAHGARIDGELALDDVDVLVVDSSRLAVCGARRWVTVHPPSQLVVLGKLPRAEREELEEIGVTLVRDIHDIAAIERALEDAMEISKQEQTNE